MRLRILEWLGIGRTDRTAQDSAVATHGADAGYVLDRICARGGMRYRIMPDGVTVLLYELTGDRAMPERIKGSYSGNSLVESVELARKDQAYGV